MAEEALCFVVACLPCGQKRWGVVDSIDRQGSLTEADGVLFLSCGSWFLREMVFVDLLAIVGVTGDYGIAVGVAS